MAGPKLDCKILSKMRGGCLAGGVHDGTWRPDESARPGIGRVLSMESAPHHLTVFSNMRHSLPSDRADNDNPRRVFPCRALLKQRLKHLDHIEDTSHIQIQNLGRGPIRRCLERSSPCRPRIGNHDIDLVRVGFDSFQKRDHSFPAADVGGYADCVPSDSCQAVQSLDGLVDAGFSGCFACRDEDKRRALEEEGCGRMES